MSTGAITLPQLPPEPAATAPWADRMRWIEAAQREAHVRATIRLAEAQEAARLVMEQQLEQAKRMADLLAQPPTPAPPAAPASEHARTVVTALVAETDKAPDAVVQAVKARIGAADSLLTPPAGA